jgi:hypothetical protein
VVEEDAARAENIVTFTIVDRDPMGIELGHPIGAARMKRGLFVLGDGLDLAEHFGGGGLIIPDPRIDQANGLQEIERTDTGDFGGGDGLVKGDTDKALRGQIVDLIRFGVPQQADRGGKIGEIVFHQMQIRVAIDTQFGYSPEIHRAGASIGPKNAIVLLKEKLRQIGAVLPGDAGDQSGFH